MPKIAHFMYEKFTIFHFKWINLIAENEIEKNWKAAKESN